MAFRRALVFVVGRGGFCAYAQSVVAPMSFVLSPTTVCGRSSREPPINTVVLQGTVAHTKKGHPTGVLFRGGQRNILA